jgi:hypothetical protein
MKISLQSFVLILSISIVLAMTLLTPTSEKGEGFLQASALR